MLYKVMRYLRNFFATDTYYSGKCTVADGVMDPPLDVGHYYLIEGSIRNNGIHLMTDYTDFKDEEFYGVITLLAPPEDFLETVEAIEKFEKQNAKTPFTSESFGGYSYTKAQGKNGPVTWKEAFASELNAWRKI